MRFREGDYVWDIRFGDGKIIRINTNKCDYPVIV